MFGFTHAGICHGNASSRQGSGIRDGEADRRQQHPHELGCHPWALVALVDATPRSTPHDAAPRGSVPSSCLDRIVQQMLHHSIE